MCPLKFFPKEEPPHLAGEAWQYNTRNGAKGTIVGTGLGSEDEVKKILANQHGCSVKDVNVIKAGEGGYEL